MNLFTRITATLGATADKAVSQFENHEAIADGALLQARQALARARVRHATLQKASTDLQSTIEGQEKQIQLWTDRAIKLAPDSETKALTCLEHKQQCEQSLIAMREAHSKQEMLVATMQGRLNQMEQKLQSMIRQRDAMRSRESVAKANAVMDRISPEGKEDVDAVFERWEMSISDAEIHSDAYRMPDVSKSVLEHQLDTEERQDALKAELADLVKASGDSNA